MLDSNKLYYLASPYSHWNPLIRFYRFWKITRIAGLLIKKYKLNLITPITASWMIQFITPSLRGDFKTWETLDLRCVQESDGLIVCLMPGWDKSIGVQAEIAHAESLNKSIYYLTTELKLTIPQR